MCVPVSTISGRSFLKPLDDGALDARLPPYGISEAATRP
jgi:hypothetical protein